MSAIVLFVLLLLAGVLLIRMGLCKCGKVKLPFLIPGVLLALFGAFGVFTALI